MNYKEIKKYLGVYLQPFLSAYDFKIIDVTTHGYKIEKKTKKLLNMCWSSKKTGANNTVELRGITLYVTLFNVENVLKEVVEKYNLEQGDCTFMNYDNSDEGVRRRNLISDILISTEEDFIRYTEVVKSFFREVAFPFFDRYNSIEAVNELINELINDVDIKKLPRHFGGGYPVNYFKIMYITKICGNEERYNLVKSRLLVAFEEDKNDTFYIEKYPRNVEAYNELIGMLEK